MASPKNPRPAKPARRLTRRATLLRALARRGLRARPATPEARAWRHLRLGLLRVKAGKISSRDLTLAQRRALSDYYRLLQSAGEKRTWTKTEARDIRRLRPYREWEKANAERALALGLGNLGDPRNLPHGDEHVFYVPADGGRILHFRDTASWKRFISLPQYRERREELLGRGRFVASVPDEETGVPTRKRTLHVH